VNNWERLNAKLSNYLFLHHEEHEENLLRTTKLSDLKLGFTFAELLPKLRVFVVDNCFYERVTDSKEISNG